MRTFNKNDYMDYIIKHDLKEEELQESNSYLQRKRRELENNLESKQKDFEGAEKNINVLISELKETRKKLATAKNAIDCYCDEIERLRSDLHSAELGIEEGNYLIKNYRRIIKDIKKISFVPGKFSKSKLSRVKEILIGVK